MNSRCSRCALLTSATVGIARCAASAGDLARMIHAHLDHAGTVGERWRLRAVQAATSAARRCGCSGCRRVASTPSSIGLCAQNRAASISLTVVLPLLPVSAISGNVEASRASARAECRSAHASVSPTTQLPEIAVVASTCRNSPPPLHRAARESLRDERRCASKRSPFKRDEEIAALAVLRVSLWTTGDRERAVADQCRVGRRASRAPPADKRHHSCVTPSRAASAARAASAQVAEADGVMPADLLVRPRGPCRRSARHRAHRRDRVHARSQRVGPR